MGIFMGYVSFREGKGWIFVEHDVLTFLFLFKKDSSQKIIHAYFVFCFASVSKHVWNNNFSELYGPNATQTFLIKYDQITQNQKSPPALKFMKHLTVNL